MTDTNFFVSLYVSTYSLSSICIDEIFKAWFYKIITSILCGFTQRTYINVIIKMLGKDWNSIVTYLCIKLSILVTEQILNHRTFSITDFLIRPVDKYIY